MRLSDVHPYRDSARNVVLSVIGYSAYCLLWRWIFRRYPLTLNDEAKKLARGPEQVAREAAQCVVAITSHMFIGPAALLMAITYFRYGTTEQGLSAYTSQPPDPFWAKMDFYMIHVGEIITGNFIFQLLFWILRWETGIDVFLHHLGFAVAGILVLLVQMYPYLSAAAIGMEVSSPFLSLHTLLRQLEGDACAALSTLSAAVFSALFFVVRIFFYGYVVLNFQYLYYTRWDIFPSWSDSAITAAIGTTFLVGWVLQLFWARMVWAKSMKSLRGLLGKRTDDTTAMPLKAEE